MNICFRIILGISVLVASGCASPNSTKMPGLDTPFLGIIFDSTVQAQNWQEYCEELAIKINTEIIEKNYLSNPIYITSSCTEITPCAQTNRAFDSVYTDLLAGELLALGVPVRNAMSEDSLIVSYSTSIVDDAQYRQKGGEVVITNAIIKNNNYIFSNSGILTITPKEYIHFFQKQSTSAATIKVRQGNQLAQNSEESNIEDEETVNYEMHIQPEPIKKGII